MDMRDWALDQGGRYWPGRASAVRALPLVRTVFAGDADGVGGLRMVSLPEWAACWDPGGGIPVPAFCVERGEVPEWQRTDWLHCAAWYLSGSAEAAYERGHGPIHSYSYKLKGWPGVIWDRAWVNRIFLFLRAWAARSAETAEDDLFGPLPEPEIRMTHDVDDVDGSMSIRVRLAVVRGVNGLKAFCRGDFTRGASLAAGGLRALFRVESMWRFEEIQEMEAARSLRSVFHFYAGRSGSLWERFVNPAYDVTTSSRLRDKLRELREGGWTVGLHPGIATWRDAERLGRDRARLESALGEPVEVVRQHWLRFSWADTWRCQSRAGFKVDNTLGFNDRPGFRTGAALEYSPWDFRSGGEHRLRVLPMAFMDGHFYHFDDTAQDDLRKRMDRWIGEVKEVRGQCSVLWHQRVVGPDYGWGRGFRELLDVI